MQYGIVQFPFFSTKEQVYTENWGGGGGGGGVQMNEAWFAWPVLSVKMMLSPRPCE